MSLRLVQTCGACPEQYDVLDGDDYVGVLRLRHGHFSAEARGEEVYSASPNGDGIFEYEERDHYIGEALEAIQAAIDGRKGR